MAHRTLQDPTESHRTPQGLDPRGPHNTPQDPIGTVLVLAPLPVPSSSSCLLLLLQLLLPAPPVSSTSCPLLPLLPAASPFSSCLVCLLSHPPPTGMLFPMLVSSRDAPPTPTPPPLKRATILPKTGPGQPKRVPGGLPEGLQTAQKSSKGPKIVPRRP